MGWTKSIVKFAQFLFCSKVNPQQLIFKYFGDVNVFKEVDLINNDKKMGCTTKIN